MKLIHQSDVEAGFDGAVRILNGRAVIIINTVVVLPINDDLFRYPNVEPAALLESLVVLTIVI
ncbi:hypothetical protein C9J12_24940 [Photobacterium frigidiphilum]|uniref:Uncharacterized protein n=1 Tax=Photobacterium frigidiphilum TaxID=264736 RepID=A0A2T3J812_9GAMM|nr:hypothetical protein C9J12_24940 [Photobacterium frigidiphilum]